MQVRGRSKLAEINDKNKSDLPSSVLYPSDAEKAKGYEEYTGSFKAKNIELFLNSPSNNNITNWDKLSLNREGSRSPHHM